MPAYETATIHGRYTKLDGTPAAGKVLIRPNVTPVPVIRDATGNVLVNGEQTVTLDETGAFALTVPATDDATLSPTAFSYTAVEQIAHIPKSSYRAVTFLAPAGTTVELADLEGAVPAEPVVSQPVTWTEFQNAVADKVSVEDLADPDSEAGQLLSGVVGTAIAEQDPAIFEGPAAAAVNNELDTSPRIPKVVVGTDALVEYDQHGSVTRTVDPATGKTWLTLDDDVDLPGEQITPGSVPSDALSPDIAVPQMLDVDLPGVSTVLMDEDGYLLPFLDTEGGVITPSATPAATGAAEVTGTTPNRKVWLYSGRGDRILIDSTHDATAVNEVRPAENGSSETVVYATATRSRWGRRDATRGTVIGGPLTPSKTTLVPIGDSVTAEGTIAATVTSDLGLSTIKTTATGGWGAGDIALKFGAYTPTLTFTGGVVPASGAGAVQSLGVNSGCRPDATGTISGSFSWTGYITTPAGQVPGTLVHNFDTQTWSFTRTGDGDAIPVPSGARFCCTEKDAEADRDGVALIRLGRNNIWAFDAGKTCPPERVADRIEEIVNRLASLGKAVVVASVINGGSELNNGQVNGYAEVIALNRELAARFGDVYYDDRREFIDHGLARAGLTPTSGELDTMALDAPPVRLMESGSGVHPSPTGYTVLGHIDADRITARSYLA